MQATRCAWHCAHTSSKAASRSHPADAAAIILSRLPSSSLGCHHPLSRDKPSSSLARQAEARDCHAADETGSVSA
eukprot:6180290-Pleurochrysis_carterae.AAC.3